MRKKDHAPINIYGLCTIRNEEDIIGEALRYGSTFCKKIFVHDTGSTDRTWDVVQEMSKNGVVVPFRKEDLVFDNSLRRHAFNEYASEVKPGDWWCVLDADEFFVEDPRILIEIPNC